MNPSERKAAMKAKVAKSSLGTPAAQKLRSRTPKAVSKSIVRQSSRLSGKSSK